MQSGDLLFHSSDHPTYDPAGHRTGRPTIWEGEDL